MLGILYTAVMSVGALFHSVKNDCENVENRTKYRSKDGLSYTDTKGRTRLTSNNKVVHYTYDKNRDYVLADAYGHVYKNYSAERRNNELEKRIQNAIKDGKTTYSLDGFDYKKYMQSSGYGQRCKGLRYVDLKTHEIYVIRRINKMDYYMNPKTGKIIRETDNQKKRLRDPEYGIDIDKFNMKQEQRLATKSKDDDLWNSYFYLNEFACFSAEEPHL